MISHTQPVDLLRKLGDHYRHVQQEHSRHPPNSAMRRRFADKMQRIRDRFDRLLMDWVLDEDLREQWREFLHGRQPAPDQPAVGVPLLFKGRTDANAVIEVRIASDGYDIFADGARIDHGEVPWQLEPDMIEPIQIGEYTCEEIFDAPVAAMRALVEFQAGGVPPWRWARELVEDGLIDAELALTPRGKRCLRRERVPRPPPPQARNYCVLIADGVRARVLLLAMEHDVVGAVADLVEVAEITNPMLRARDVQIVADNHPEVPNTRRGLSDHRDHHRRVVATHFASRIAEEAAAAWRRYPACELIVAASPVMLGLLRPAIQNQLRVKDHVAVHEITRDLTKLVNAAVHDLLADAKLLPARIHRSTRMPAPGVPM